MAVFACGFKALVTASASMLAALPVDERHQQNCPKTLVCSEAGSNPDLRKILHFPDRYGISCDVPGKDFGRGDRIRTCDPLLPKQMRYQAALLPDAGSPSPADGRCTCPWPNQVRSARRAAESRSRISRKRATGMPLAAVATFNTGSGAGDGAEGGASPPRAASSFCTPRTV